MKKIKTSIENIAKNDAEKNTKWKNITKYIDETYQRNISKNTELNWKGMFPAICSARHWGIGY
jgi:hypothetical protein